MKLLLWIMALMAFVPVAFADESYEVFSVDTEWKMIGPNHKIVIYGVSDPVVDGVTCHFAQPEKGGLSGAVGLAEEVSDISLACRQTGPIRFKKDFKQGDEALQKRRSLVFKSMQIVRACDADANTLIYLVYSDKVVSGSPKNSISTVPIAPWGDGPAPKCADFLKD